MYLEYFGLDTDPFRLSPDAKFFFPSQSHMTAKSYMDYVLWSRDSFILITGEIGSGKTTLIQKMLDEADQDIILAKIHQTQLTEFEFLQALLDQFGLEPFEVKSKVQLHSMLNKFLQEKYEDGIGVVVIIDEAQNLSEGVLEEIRLISGFDSSREKILNIFLVGQPELREKLMSPQMEQLLQRIRLRFHINGLGFDEVRAYIRHRLSISSENKFYRVDETNSLLAYQKPYQKIPLTSDLFTDELLPVIMEYTGGIPRLINTLCDTIMLTAFARESKVLNEDIVVMALEELQWPKYKDREINNRYQKILSQGDHPSLVVKSKNTVVSVEKLVKSKVYIGRSHLCDVVINQKSISAKHFIIQKDEASYSVTDLDSTNGTFVNGQRITKKQTLHDGDVIKVGRYILVFTEDEEKLKGKHVSSIDDKYLLKQSI